MTIGEAISMVRSSFKLIDADNVITNRVCASELRACTLKLLKQQTDRRKLFSSSNLFTELPCLAMQEVPLSSCCDYQSPCMISKSTLKLPMVAENILGPLVQGVYSIDNGFRFEYADPDRYANLLKIYPKKKDLNYWWLRSGYLYVTNPQIEMVRLFAYFEEDITVADYSCSGAGDCPDNPLDQPFRCPGYLIEDVVNMTRMVIERDYKRSVDDKTVDNNDESK